MSPNNQNALRNSTNVIEVIRTITTTLKVCLQNMQQQQLIRKLPKHTKSKKRTKISEYYRLLEVASKFEGQKSEIKI